MTVSIHTDRSSLVMNARVCRGEGGERGGLPNHCVTINNKLQQ